MNENSFLIRCYLEKENFVSLICIYFRNYNCVYQVREGSIYRVDCQNLVSLVSPVMSLF